MLVLSRKSGESVMIDGRIEVRITEISGDKVKLGIEAPGEVKILRKELFETIRENQSAATAAAGGALKDFLHSLH